ncbi:MAG: sugar phosphate isomerase/epimerase [Verrucomicrobia bacterium]|jgi:sugar phosphate isomerase/epimerase|nr:sugar phosphate isomerase/epimerase [Verrucomicrobiota bacterium]MBT5480900.1 sugar phosphate isomerase/epimerase [Verrucomicrobiota bacterium]MBT6806366.1 sugar phosphate isomerase/epimerase [Verrucomicrobiota bacterium]MBT7874387.1 sugar phosphate isomerase/epimerase [Verrucomicrobiota bacterium]MDA7534557.1 sugar phosphate isomerase/epimerase [Verrucomicrobiota bacterium]
MMHRRTFLSRTLIAAAGAGATWFDVPSVIADTREQSLKKYGGFPMGIQSYSLRAFGIDGALEKIEELELHFVELFRMHYPPIPDPLKIAEMNAKLRKHDLSISAHGVQSFTKDHQKNKAFFEFAKKAGIRNISANPEKDSFESLNRLVAEYDIRIAIHNHGPGALYDAPLDALKAVAGYDKRIGFCADLGHYIRSGVDPVEVIYQLGDRLYGVHLKDFAEQKKKTEGVIIGRGHLDVEGVFKALKKIGFPADGALSLEYEENPKDPMEDIRACLNVAAEAAQRAARS